MGVRLAYFTESEVWLSHLHHLNCNLKKYEEWKCPFSCLQERKQNIGTNTHIKTNVLVEVKVKNFRGIIPTRSFCWACSLSKNSGSHDKRPCHIRHPLPAASQNTSPLSLVHVVLYLWSVKISVKWIEIEFCCNWFNLRLEYACLGTQKRVFRQYSKNKSTHTRILLNVLYRSSSFVLQLQKQLRSSKIEVYPSIKHLVEDWLRN